MIKYDSEKKAQAACDRKLAAPVSLRSLLTSGLSTALLSVGEMVFCILSKHYLNDDKVPPWAENAKAKN